MESVDVDKLISVSELDEMGSLNYDEALKTSLNELMEAELTEMVEEQEDQE